MTWIDDRAFRGLKDFVSGAGPGDVLGGRWEIRQPIGEGGMAVVYAGLDRDTKREVAIKIIRAYGDHDDARFLREVTALERAAHPAIVRYIAHGVHEDERYVVMERLVGCTLAERLRRGALSAGDAMALARRMAGGLAAVHSAGITHRDIKPANVFLPAECVTRACLVDFGLARPANATALTRKGVLVGTPGYMAPEQVRGESDVGTAADVFALGCVLWECVTGRPPFVAEDDEELFRRILLAEVPPLDAERVPPAFSELVARMLAKDPSRRPQASDLGIAFEKLAPSGAESTELAPGIGKGDIIDEKYRIDRVLGSGGMGIVVAAHHLELGTQVALKLLRSADTGDRARFDREARAASRLESEHVARVLDVGQTAEGTPYLVMEHLTGTDLADRLAAHGPLSVETAVTYVLETCEAIAEAHALGIVHRDLKPSNLFVVERRDGSQIIKVLDFGISKLTERLEDASRPPTITDAKVVMGSIPYMSPEQLQSSTRVDFRSDVWSLGIVLHELVTGQRPFEGQNATAVAARIAASPPTRLREVRPEAPVELETVILRCLEKDPSRRYASLAAFARALAPLAPPTAHPSIGRVTHLLGSPSEALSTPPPRSRSWIAAILVLTVAAAVGLWPRSQPSPHLPIPSPSPSPKSSSSASATSEPVPTSFEAPPRPAETKPAPPRPSRRPRVPPSASASAPAAPPVRAPSSTEVDLRDPSLETR